MHIIFDEETKKTLETKYTVLELDTIKQPGLENTITAWAVIETIPFTDIPTIESMRNLHGNLLIEYRKRNWNYCRQAITHLQGRWGGELDSFYAELSGRLDEFEQQEPGPEWDGVYEKNSSIG